MVVLFKVVAVVTEIGIMGMIVGETIIGTEIIEGTWIIGTIGHQGMTGAVAQVRKCGKQLNLKQIIANKIT